MNRKKNDFDSVCRKIDWARMAKGRRSVKNLVEKKPSLRYIADFLDLLAETAVDIHGVRLSEVYPSAGHASLIAARKEQDKIDSTILKG